MKEKIFFRADGGSTTGLGHLVRSMALAEMLKEEYKIDFFCKEAPESIEEKIKEAGFGFIRIADEEAFFARAKVIVVILDGYGFKSDYQKRLKDQECTVVCIDDLHEGEFFADLIINHAPGITPEDYKAQSYTKFALGLEYALLRPAFLEAAKRAKEEKPIENVFICFGGADPENLTLQALEAAMEVNTFKKINVVTGASYLHNESVQQYVGETVNLYSDLDEIDMCRVMLDSDIAIVPSSSILLESLACGLKVMTCYYVDNQKDFHNEIVKSGITTIGKVDKNYKEKLKQILIDSSDFSYIELKKNFVGVRKRLINIFKYFNKNTFNIEIAKISDLTITFDWANNTTIRAFSFNSDQILLDEHSKWFASKINNKNCLYFIAKIGNFRVGSIRYDINSDEALISFLIDPNFHGRGLGHLLLLEGKKKIMYEKPNINKLFGYVMEKNIASKKAFLKADYIIESVEANNIKFVMNL